MKKLKIKVENSSIKTQEAARKIYKHNWYLRNKEYVAKYEHQRYLKSRDKIIQRIRKYARVNKDKIRETKKKYWVKNKKHLREKRKEWELKNKDHIRTFKREYYLKNKTKILVYLKRYYQDHKEKHLQQSKEWRLKNRIRSNQIMLACARRRKQQIKLQGGYFTEAQWQELISRYPYCPLCKREWDLFLKPTIDHIIPVSKGGINNISNIQPLCKNCNPQKGNRII